MAYIGKKPSFSQVRTAELVVQRGTDISTAGTIAALDVSNISLVRLTAATVLQGIVAPSAPADNGKRVTLINANSSDLIVGNESGSASASNRISTGISRDMRITPGASLTLTYNTASLRWSVESSSAEINIDRLRVASEVVSSGPDISVLNSGNGKSTLLELTTGFGTSVRSIAAGLSGQFVVLVNKTGSLIQVANEDSGATAGDRILTGTGGPISLQNNASLFLAYLTDNSSASRWQVVGGTGSGGGATEQVTQTGIGNLTNFPVGTPLYVDATTGWTAANASAANTAEVAGMIGRSLSADLAEVVMAGEVAGVTASVFTEAVLPARGEVVFLSTTSGKLTITEPSVVGQVSKPLGVVHNVNGSTSVDIMFFNWRGSVVGGANARTTISLANSATTSVQNVSAYDAGELAGWVFIDATTDRRFYIQAQFAKNGAGTDYNLSYQTTGDTPPAGFSMTVTAAGVIQVTLPSVAGFSAASINYALNAPAVGASLPLAIDGSNVVNSLTNVAAGTAAAPSYSFTGDNNTGMYLVSADVLGLSTAGVQRVVVDASGNVGIGRATNLNGSASSRAIGIGGSGTIMSNTSNGSTYVAQNLYFDGSVWRYLNTAASGLYEMGAGTHIWYTAASGTAGNSASPVQALLIDSSNIIKPNAPIITNTIASALVGRIQFDEVATTGTQVATALHWQTIQSGAGYRQHAAIGSVRTGGADFGYVFLGVGQNDNAITSAFTFYGNGAAFQGNNSSTWSVSSDIRIKQNVRPVNNCLDKVAALNPVHFEYIHKPDQIKTGFIAQEFEQILPGHVIESACPTEISEIKPELQQEKIKAIDADLIPYLVGAIKELSAKNDALEARLAALESK